MVMVPCLGSPNWPDRQQYNHRTDAADRKSLELFRHASCPSGQVQILETRMVSGWRSTGEFVDTCCKEGMNYLNRRLHEATGAEGG